MKFNKEDIKEKKKKRKYIVKNGEGKDKLVRRLRLELENREIEDR
jgi:hypothetical protein